MTLGGGAVERALGLDEAAPGVGLAGLDAHGRVRDLHWKQSGVGDRKSVV